MENPKIPTFLRAATMLAGIAVAWAGLLLFALPALGREEWAWITPLFNSRFIGAVYFGAFVPLLIVSASGRWTPGRVVLWMVFTFTTEIMLVMFFYTDRFLWGRAYTYGFWALYVFFPVNSAVFLYLCRGLARPKGTPKNQAWRRLLTVSAVLLAGYGVALLIAPRTLASFWPWPVEDFHGRIYAAPFLTSAVGTWLVRRRATVVADATVGAWLLAFGIFTIAGVLISDTAVPASKRVDFAAAGTWGFLLMSLAMVVLGAALVMRLRSGPREGYEALAVGSASS